MTVEDETKVPNCQLARCV